MHVRDEFHLTLLLARGARNGGSAACARTATEERPFPDHSALQYDYLSLTPSTDTAMTLKSESTFPSRRTYVLKLRNDAGPDALAGRLENLVTGGQREFTSGRELLESIVTDLSASVAERPAD